MIGESPAQGFDGDRCRGADLAKGERGGAAEDEVLILEQDLAERGDRGLGFRPHRAEGLKGGPAHARIGVRKGPGEFGDGFGRVGTDFPEGEGTRLPDIRVQVKNQCLAECGRGRFCLLADAPQSVSGRVPDSLIGVAQRLDQLGKTPGSASAPMLPMAKTAARRTSGDESPAAARMAGSAALAAGPRFPIDKAVACRTVRSGSRSNCARVWMAALVRSGP